MHARPAVSLEVHATACFMTNNNERVRTVGVEQLVNTDVKRAIRRDSSIDLVFNLSILALLIVYPPREITNPVTLLE